MAKRTKAEKSSNESARGFTLTEDMISAPVKSTEVALAARRISTKYVPLINAVLSMKAGQTITVPIPSDTTLNKFRATVSSTLRKRLDGKLGSNRLSFGVTEGDGALAISLVKG